MQNHHKFDPNLICPLCGIRKAQSKGKKYTSQEHIPPKSIFTDSRKNLIKVPSCKECNNGTSKWDEKFKSQLGLYFGHQVPKLWFSALRTLNHIGNKGFKEEIKDKTSPLMTQNGAFGWGHKIQINPKPMKTVLRKMVRGLHWFITGQVLPTDCKISIKLIKQRETIAPEIKDILNHHGKWIETGDKTFETQYAITEDHEYASLWLFRFYGEDCFIISIT